MSTRAITVIATLMLTGAALAITAAWAGVDYQWASTAQHAATGKLLLLMALLVLHPMLGLIWRGETR